MNWESTTCESVANFSFVVGAVFGAFLSWFIRKVIK